MSREWEDAECVTVAYDTAKAPGRGFRVEMGNGGVLDEGNGKRSQSREKARAS